MRNILIILTIFLSASCSTHEVKPKQKAKLSIGKINLTDTTHFKLVKTHIQEVGTVRKANATSTADKEFIITYHIVNVEDMEVSIDHTDRIYMSQNKIHFGNILIKNSVVTPEINYGVPDKDPTLTKEKERRVLEIYEKLISLALNN